MIVLFYLLPCEQKKWCLELVPIDLLEFENRQTCQVHTYIIRLEKFEVHRYELKRNWEFWKETEVKMIVRCVFEVNILQKNSSTLASCSKVVRHLVLCCYQECSFFSKLSVIATMLAGTTKLWFWFWLLPSESLSGLWVCTTGSDFFMVIHSVATYMLCETIYLIKPSNNQWGGARVMSERWVSGRKE